MNETAQAPPASGMRIAVSAIISAIVAAIILVLFVLPAEYALDPTGIGSKLGLTQMTVPPEPTRTLEVSDPLAGNEDIMLVEIPDFGEPVPLPNPGIHQLEDRPPRSETREIMIDAEGETEIKTVLQQSKVLVYSWRTDRGDIYSDFHGHDPEAGDEFWVRYLEDQEGSNGHSGSLVAPFDGEHGWYWLNYNDFPVTVTLTITGYYDDVIDYSNLF
jgi:hypothetical protein